MGFHDLREMTKARFAEYCAIYNSLTVEMSKILGGIETKEVFGRSEFKELEKELKAVKVELKQERDKALALRNEMARREAKGEKTIMT